MLEGKNPGTVIHKETMRFNDCAGINVLGNLAPRSRT